MSVNEYNDPIAEAADEINRLCAEIARLKQFNLMTDEQVVMDLKAEVERLTRELREEREAFLSRQLHDTAEITELKEIIEGLCEDLEEEFGMNYFEHLNQRPWTTVRHARNRLEELKHGH